MKMRKLLYFLIVLLFCSNALSQGACFTSQYDVSTKGLIVARALEKGDFNNDGVQDLIEAPFTLGDPNMIFSKGFLGGAFAAPVSFSVIQRIADLKAGDFNNDGNLDFAAAAANDSKLVICFGNGNGTFQTPVQYTTGNAPLDISVADFDGNGLKDIVVATINGVEFFKNQSGTPGTFAASVAFAMTGTSRGIVSGDFNGDGKIDVATTEKSTALVSVRMGDGLGGFAARVDYATQVDPFKIVAGDVNNDGRLDLVCSNETSNSFTLILNSAGGFLAPTHTASPDTNPDGIQLADFNNDAKLDVAMVSYGNSKISVFLGNGSGAFVLSSTNDAKTTPHDLICYDASGDGKIDALCSTDVGARILVFKGLGNGNFQQPSPYYSVGNTPTDIHKADFNGDGKQDIVVVNSLANNMEIMIGAGNGTFSFGGTFTTDTKPVGVRAADLNGDGKMDVVTLNETNKTISVFIGNGTGGFAAKMDYSTGTVTPRVFEVGNVDADTDIDIIVGSTSQKYSVIKNNGAGIFAAPAEATITGFTGEAGGIVIFNADTDTDNDFVITCSDAKVRYFRNAGTGTFNLAQNVATGTNPKGLDFGDYDNDGFIDLVVAEYGGTNLKLHKGSINTGTYIIGAASNISQSGFSAPIDVEFADFNNDNKLDVFAIYEENIAAQGDAAIFMGNGTSTFTFYNSFGQDIGPKNLVLGDWNNDTRLDLASVNSVSNTVTVLNNTTAIVTPNGAISTCSTASTTLTTPTADFYTWSSGQTTQNISPSASGTYTVTSGVGAWCSSTAAIPATITMTTGPNLTLTNDLTICSGGTAQLVVSGSNGAYSWRDEFGNNLGANDTINVLPTVNTKYYVTGTDINTCSSTDSVTVSIVSPPTASISYAGAPFCVSLTGAQSVTLSGTGSYTGGTYSSSAGLSINASTGAITPSLSTVGSYVVTYSIPAAGGCAAVSATVNVSITPGPTASILYTGTPFCTSNGTAQSVTITGTGAYTGGTYSSSAGLSINPSTGAIMPSTSTAGSYIVTYTIPASGGCASSSVTANAVITSAPTATISYSSSSFCTTVTSEQAVTINGTGAYVGGTYSSSAGLIINTSTGAIIPSSSTPGTYTVTYTIPASGGCSSVSVTTSVTITALPTVSLTYPGTPFCTSIVTAQTVSLSGTGNYTGGSYSSSAGLSINASTGAITPSSSSAGTYSVTYTTPASGGCSTVTGSTLITVTQAPTASITYSGTPFCKSIATAQSVSLTGTGSYTGGTYSSSVGLTIHSTTGAITPNTSTPGTYSVTYTIPASGGCAAVSVTTSVTITAVPTASISYAASPFCTSVLTAQSVSITGTGSYTAGTYSSSAGLTINSSSGAITPNSSTPGTYTISYTIPASGGCASSTVNTTAIVTALPTASISYSGSPFCTSVVTAQSVSITGTGTYTGGTYSSSAGLSLNTVTGAITPSTSTPGTYTVTYTTPASGGCSVVTATTNVTINPGPSASILYSGSPFCNTIGTAQPVSITGTGAYTGGGYASSVGLTLNATTGAITPNTSTPGTYTVTYTIPASGGCAATPITTTATITASPTASISYSASAYCTSVSGTLSPTLSGTGAYTGGTYSSTVGLTINGSTGAITPSTSTSGTYTVTYTVPATGGCSTLPVTTTVTIHTAPTASISYASSPFCSTLNGFEPVTLTGTGAYTGGSYTSLASLTLNAGSGAIKPSSSSPGSYTVTYTIPTFGSCAATPVSTTVQVTAVPTASISYSGSPYCTSIASAQSPTLTGTGTYTGGTYSSTAGLTINGSTGAITPSTSTPGTYTVTYTVPATGGCSAVPVTTTITINAGPTANISYAGAPFCSSVASAQAVTLTGTGAYTGGTYSSTAGLSLNAGNGAITPSTSTPGTYTVTYTIPASGGCAATPVSTTVQVTAVPTASISYSGSPYCTSIASAQSPTLTGTGAYTGGTYSSTAGLTINGSTGAITPSTSTPGTYTVTYTVPATGGCSAVPVTTTITINAGPTASISYAGAPFCSSVASAQAVTLTGTGAYTGGTYSSTAGLSLNTTNGEILPNSSTPGTYTVTYTIPASGGCAVVTVTTTVTINSIPNATFTGLAASYCQNAAATTLSPTVGGGSFSGSTGLSSNTFNASGAVIGTNTVTYTVTVAGCTNSSSQTTNVIASPNASFSGLAASYCSNTTYSNLTPLVSGGIFSGGSGVSGTRFTPSSASIGTNNVTYTVTVSGCTNSSTQTTVVNALPNATFTGLMSTYCSNDPAVTLIPNVSGGTFIGSTGISGAVFSPSTAAIGSNSVTYALTVNGCTNSSSQNTVVNVAPSITIVDYVSGTLYAQTSGTVTSYKWYDCDANQLIAGATSSSYSPSANGNYSCIVTNGGCSDTSACTSVGNLSIEEVGTIHVKFYPNPNTGIFNVELQEDMNYKLFDATGKLLTEGALKAGTNQLNFSDILSQGVYRMSIFGQHGNKSVPFVVLY